MIGAQNNLQPAKIDTGIGYLVNVTVNRRAKISPYVDSGSIDPNVYYYYLFIIFIYYYIYYFYLFLYINFFLLLDWCFES